MGNVKSKNRAVLVTGGAKRLGKEIAILFAGLGYDIALHYNSSFDEAVEVATIIKKKYDINCNIYKADLSNENELLNLANDISSDFSNIEILINSASIFTRANIKNTDFNTFNDNFNINLKAPFFLTKFFCEQVIKQEKSNINNFNIINLLDTKIDKKNQTVYSAYSLSKMALAEFTKLSAIEYAENNIRVNGIAIGTILPPEVDSQFNKISNLKNNNLLGRIGNVENLKKTILFLLDNDFITGEIIFVDGGEKLV